MSAEQPDEHLLGAGKPLALLIYLAFAHRHSASRSELVDLLWSDAPPEPAAAALRQTLWYLRRLLGAEALSNAGGTVRLTVPFESDRLDFESALEGGDWEKAVALHATPFLTTFSTPGGATFEQWADLERDRLRSGYHHALQSLAESRLEAGRFREARDYARQLRDSDPEREQGWRLLFEVLASTGDATAVAIETEAFRRHLAADGREADPATRQLLSRFTDGNRTAPDQPSSAEPLAADLVGRSQEFAALVHEWQRARRGPTRAAAVVASAGLGKTRILHDLANRVRASGDTTVMERANPGGTSIPGSFASQVARSLATVPGALGIPPAAASSLVALDPVLSATYRVEPDRSSGGDATRRRVLALASLLEAVCDEQPVTLLLDDLHWADRDSREMLQAALDHVRAARLLVVSASRSPEHVLRGPGAGAPIDLRPLTMADVEALLGSLGRLPDESWVQEFVQNLHHASTGSPLLIFDTIERAVGRGVLALSGGEWAVPDPAALRAELKNGQALRTRIADLPRDERELLTLLCGMGAPAPTDMMVRATRWPGDAVGQKLAVLEQRGLAIRAGARWLPAHDRIADVILDALGSVEARDLHWRLGRAMAGTGSLHHEDYRHAARHFAAAGATEDLSRLYLEWRRHTKALGVRRADPVLVDDLLGQLDGQRYREALLSARPILERVGARAIVSLAAVGLLIATVLGATMSRMATVPSQLAVIERPLAPGEQLVPDFVIEVQDRRGRRVDTSSDTIALEVVSGGGRVEGATSLTAVDGRVRFPGLRWNPTEQDEVPRLRFTSGTLRSVDVELPFWLPAVRLVEAEFNDQPLSPSNRTIRIASGARLAGSITIAYDAPWTSGTVWLGVAFLWADRQTGALGMRTLQTPARDRQLSDSLIIPGPDAPGRYLLIVALSADESFAHVASGTNWTAGAPRWNDGNDLADWTDVECATANRVGWIEGRIYRVYDLEDPPIGPVYARSELPATCLVVEVLPR